MKCSEFRQDVHLFLDLCLNGKDHYRMDLHRRQCPYCNSFYLDLVEIKTFIGGKASLPPASSQVVLKRIRRKRRFAPLLALRDAAADLRSYLRDLNYVRLCLRVSSTPITALLFFALLQALAPVQVEKLPFLLISSADSSRSIRSAPPRVINVEVRQSRDNFNHLVDTAWRLPYEDSLSLVAEINQDGFPQIGDVLEYPKSPALFSAVDLALKQTQFEQAEGLKSPLLIYSFQKIDVYDDSRGL